MARHAPPGAYDAPLADAPVAAEIEVGWMRIRNGLHGLEIQQALNLIFRFTDGADEPVGFRCLPGQEIAKRIGQPIPYPSKAEGSAYETPRSPSPGDRIGMSSAQSRTSRPNPDAPMISNRFIYDPSGT